MYLDSKYTQKMFDITDDNDDAQVNRCHNEAVEH